LLNLEQNNALKDNDSFSESYRKSRANPATILNLNTTIDHENNYTCIRSMKGSSNDSQIQRLNIKDNNNTPIYVNDLLNKINKSKIEDCLKNISPNYLKPKENQYNCSRCHSNFQVNEDNLHSNNSENTENENKKFISYLRSTNDQIHAIGYSVKLRRFLNPKRPCNFSATKSKNCRNETKVSGFNSYGYVSYLHPHSNKDTINTMISDGSDSPKKGKYSKRKVLSKDYRLPTISFQKYKINKFTKPCNSEIRMTHEEFEKHYHQSRNIKKYF